MKVFRKASDIPEIVRYGDLLVDRAVTDSAEDRLSHTDLAVTLSDIIRIESAPLNIAVYAPWGSGKTGLANLLGPMVEKDRRIKTKFVRYDAFKYVALPLRKSFLMFLSGHLNNKKAQKLVQQRLYSTTTRTEPAIKASLPEFLKLVLVFGAIFVIWLTIPALLTWLLPGKSVSFLDALSIQFDKYGLIGFLLSAIMSGVSGLLRNMNFTSKEEPGVSDEQLEQLFRIIIRKSGYEKIVIFIDELDRCGPSEVVETLESLKTFFEIDKCVFVVAADRQVLVESLVGHVSQATPTRLAGAEYAAASEYLDKIFGVQFSFPEVRNSRLTQYGVEIAESQGGVWRELNIPEVISVLIPSHVVSPRRVKALMNAYSIAYRVVVHRASIGSIRFDEERTPLELAKWVALRHEFPNFASLLRLDNAACEIYLRRRGKDAGDVRVREDLARAFDLLESVPVLDERLDSGKTDKNPRFLHDELIAYLEKTRFIEKISLDLIFLESAGPLYDVDAGLIEHVESLAVNGQTISLIGALENQDQKTVKGVISYLIGRTDLFGVEKRNVFKSLLSIVARFGSEMSREEFDTFAAEFGALMLDVSGLPAEEAATLLYLHIHAGVIQEERLQLLSEIVANEADSDTVAGILTPHFLADERVSALVVKICSGLIWRDNGSTTFSMLNQKIPAACTGLSDLIVSEVLARADRNETDDEQEEADSDFHRQLVAGVMESYAPRRADASLSHRFLLKMLSEGGEMFTPIVFSYVPFKLEDVELRDALYSAMTSWDWGEIIDQMAQDETTSLTPSAKLSLEKLVRRAIQNLLTRSVDFNFETFFETIRKYSYQDRGGLDEWAAWLGRHVTIGLASDSFRDLISIPPLLRIASNEQILKHVALEPVIEKIVDSLEDAGSSSAELAVEVVRGLIAEEDVQVTKEQSLSVLPAIAETDLLSAYDRIVLALDWVMRFRVQVTRKELGLDLRAVSTALSQEPPARRRSVLDKWLGTVGNSVADVEEYAGLVRIVSESGQKAAAAIFRRVPTSDILNALCSRIERQAVDPAPPGYYRMYSGIALPVRPIRRALRHAYESATNHQRKESLVRAWDELSPASEELKAAFTKELFLKLMKDDAKKTRMLACKHFNLVNTLEDPALRAQIVRAINGKKLVDIKARLEQKLKEVEWI